MTREAKMLAVVEAAREALTSLRNTRTNIMVAEKYDARWADVPELLKPTIDALANALADLEPLAALDAYTEAEAETVTLEAWSHLDGDVVLVLPGSPLAREYPGNDYRQYRGTVTLPITREGGR